MPRDIWIGLQFLFSTRENKWIDESRLLYSNFHPLLTGRLRKIPLDVSSGFGLLDFSGLLSNEILNIGCIKREKKKAKRNINKKNRLIPPDGDFNWQSDWQQWNSVYLDPYLNDVFSVEIQNTEK